MAASVKKKDKSKVIQPEEKSYPSYDSDQPEYKDYAKLYLSKADIELFDEAKAVPAPIVRVKRTSTPAKGERWRITRDDELLCVIDGVRLTKKEREFLRTLEGVSFLIREFKAGAKQFADLRFKIKEIFKEKN